MRSLSFESEPELEMGGRPSTADLINQVSATRWRNRGIARGRFAPSSGVIPRTVYQSLADIDGLVGNLTTDGANPPYVFSRH